LYFPYHLQKKSELRQKARHDLEKKLTKEGLQLKKYMNEEQLAKMKEKMKDVPVIEYFFFRFLF